MNTLTNYSTAILTSVLLNTTNDTNPTEFITTALAAADDDGIKAEWYSILPPILALSMALITKEVYSSLFCGIMLGALIYVCANGLFFINIFKLPLVMIVDEMSGGTSIILFGFLLGAFVYIITSAGGTIAYGKWAVKAIKSKIGAQFATVVLGAVVFIDDYFSCIAVGAVMKPVTDLNKISREKLAYLVDATSATMCVLIPISSWTAVIISAMEESTLVNNGMMQFINTIPFNLYGLLTIFMITIISLTGIDYGPMAEAEKREANRVDEISSSSSSPESVNDNDANKVEKKSNSEPLQSISMGNIKTSDKGKVYDLLIPLLLLVIFAFLLIVYNGGGFDGTGKSVADIFGDSDVAISLCMSTSICIFICMLMYVPRKIMTSADILNGIIEGMKMMVPTIIVLCLAWANGSVAKNYLLTGVWMGDIIQNSNFPKGILPFIVFIFSAFLSFSIGSAWGTFGILISIINGICERVCPELHTICLGAVLSGSIFGDHCSPISDTTVISSTACDCDHMKHVSTQLPYALTTAFSCAIGFLFGGLSGGKVYITLPVGLACQVVFISLLYQMYKHGLFDKFSCYRKRSKIDKENENTTNIELPKKSVTTIKLSNSSVDNSLTNNKPIKEVAINTPDAVV